MNGRRLVCLGLVVFFCYRLLGQDASLLTRGWLPENINYLYNGTYYLEDVTFQKGSIFYNGISYDNVYLNIDAYHQQVQVKVHPSAAAVVLFREQIASLTMGKKTYVNLQYLGYPDAPEGFYEVVKDGPVPYLQQCRKIIHVDTQRDMDVPNFFIPQIQYYKIADGQLVSMRKRRFNREVKNAADTPNLLTRITWHGNAPASGEWTPLTLPKTGIGLPDGYFSATQDTLVYEDNDYLTQKASYRNKLYVIGREEAGKERFQVSGVVTELETGARLPGVWVHDEVTSTYVRTDAQGRYKITLPKGMNVLYFVDEAKEEQVLDVNVLGSGSLDVALNEKITLLKESVISASSMEKHRSTSLGVENLSMNTMGKIPSAFGEGDIVKAMLTLPGVKSSGEAAGGINVRGGSTGENLILFNENTIYNPSHLFGVFSSFNPDLVEGLSLYKGSVPVEYGGRISSVMQVRLKDGSFEKWKGSLGIGLVTGRIHVEGPIVKGKTSIIAGFRTTYSDWLLKSLPANSYYSGASAGFTDANLGITHRFNNGGQLNLSAYYAQDSFVLQDNLAVRYDNINGSVEYRRRNEDGGVFRTSAGYDRYRSAKEDYSWQEGSFQLETIIQQVFHKSVWKMPLGNTNTLTAGYHALLYALEPDNMYPMEGSNILTSRLPVEYGIEPSLFVSDEFRPFETLSVEGGLRLSSFWAPGMQKPYLGPEARISAKYSPVEVFSVKGGFDLMNQYIHLISNTAGISPTDTWKLSNNTLEPTRGWQGTAGVYWTMPSTGIDFSMEAYWKQTSRNLDYKDGAQLVMNPALEAELVPVYGRAYGVEWMVKKPTGRLTGWISYTWSRSFYREMEDRGAQTIANGNWYNAPFDKPHEVKIAVNYALTHRYSFSLNVDYSTGRPITVPIGKYIFGNAWHLAYSERNAYRIPDYFRVDLAMNIDPGHYLKAFTHASITLGVYNLLGRKNPYSVYFRTSANGEVKGYMLSVFATQVPYINLNFLF